MPLLELSTVDGRRVFVRPNMIALVAELENGEYMLGTVVGVNFLLSREMALDIVTFLDKEYNRGSTDSADWWKFGGSPFEEDGDE